MERHGYRFDQFLVGRHHDKDNKNPHFHFLANVVLDDGTRANLANIGKAAKEASISVTEQWGLTPANHWKRMQTGDKKDTNKNESRTAEIHNHRYQNYIKWDSNPASNEDSNSDSIASNDRESATSSISGNLMEGITELIVQPTVVRIGTGSGSSDNTLDHNKDKNKQRKGGQKQTTKRRTQKVKTENGNKRTKRKEIQFNEAEYAVVEQKANAARLSVAAFIREAALGKELSAALSLEESERMKRTANISYKMQVNLNQIARLANIHGLPFVTDAIREYINRTNEYFKTGTWREMDLSAYESEQKQREQLAAKVRELQEKNTELQKAATNYYLYTAEGERLFCERHNCRIYPDNRGIYWHFKVADYPAYTLPAEISKAYLNHEISIRDVYVYWRKNDR